MVFLLSLVFRKVSCIHACMCSCGAGRSVLATKVRSRFGRQLSLACLLKIHSWETSSQQARHGRHDVGGVGSYPPESASASTVPLPTLMSQASSISLPSFLIEPVTHHGSAPTTKKVGWGRV